MQPNKIVVVILVLIVGTCFAGIIVKTTDPIKIPELIDAAVDILTSCYGERGPIGIIGKLPRTFLTKLWSMKPIPVMLIDKSKRIADYDEFNPKLSELRVVLIIASDWRETFADLMSIYNSRLFESSASFVVLCASPKMTDGCAQVTEILHVLRDGDVFNANVLCVNRNRNILIYGYNPYRIKAPPPWQFIRPYNGGRVRYFLFHRRYQAGNGTCNNLDYGRTKDLGGANLILGTVSRDWIYVFKIKKRSRIRLEMAKILNIWLTISRQINANPMIQMFGNSNDPRRNLIRSFICIDPTELHNIPFNETIIAPILQTSNRIMTQFRGNKSQLRKILTVIDVKSRICVGLTILVTLIFFKFFVRQHFIPGILNVIRMMCNTGFKNLPENVSSRTYLACLFLFVVTIHGIFSGNLASLLTTEIPVRHPVNEQDLLDMNYTFYVPGPLLKFLDDPKYEGRVVRTNQNKNWTLCYRYVLRDPMAACIGETYDLMDSAEICNLYVSRTDMFESYTSFMHTWQYPYTETVNTILLRMFAADITHLWYNRAKVKLMNERYSYMQIQTIPPRIMNLQDLSFAFAILGIGLGFAIISFIIEISIHPICSRISKVRRYFRR